MKTFIMLYSLYKPHTEYPRLPIFNKIIKCLEENDVGKYTG